MASVLVCAAARPSWAATVTFGSFAEGKTASNTTSVSVGLPSGLAAGDLLIAAVATDGNTSASLSAPLGQGWTLISRNAQATVATLGVWWKIASGSELAAQQFTWSTSERAYGWIMRFQGHDPVAPIHVFAITGGTATSPACPSVTTTVPNTMLLRIGGFDDPTINVDNAGMVGHTTITMDFSHSGTGAASGGAAYILRPSTGSTGTSSFVLTASQEYRTMTLAIAPAECVSASECDDGNLCTTDTCNASGLCENNNNSLPCNDGSPCTLGDACSGGACVGGPPPNCSSAGNACNTASCDPGGADGNCAVLTPVTNGTTCNDGLFCTATDTCQGGVCTGAGDPCPGLFCLEVSDNCVECRFSLDCDDGIACTVDTCSSNVCSNTVNHPACNDGLFCNGAETCSATLGCQAGTPPCPDSVSCTVDSCDEGNNTCSNAPNDAACDDGLFCNGAETCHATLGCQAGSTPCVDGVTCTDDSCNETLDSCSHAPNNASCDDGLFCNGAETCHATLGCQSGTAPCDDAVPCTDDSCNEALDSCLNTPNHANCDNGLFCDGAETCDAVLGCQLGTAPCNDAVPCTDDSCNETLDTCSNTPNSANCDDGLFCNGAETCHATLGCQASVAPCDDGVTCTDDSCDEPTDSCANVENDALCDDGLFCNGAETCDALLDCLAGANPCDDAVACTDDACNETLDTCSNTANNSNCDDGLFCNGIESCDAQLDCQSGTAPCVDAVACTDDSCNETLDACVNAPNNARCEDGLFCNGAETCDALLGCLDGTVPCDDSVACTDDSCNETLDACSNTPNSANCDDGMFCNGAETCHATLGCQVGAPPCDDGVTCTDDSCDEPTDACTNIENDALCDDALFCNGVETCDAVLDCLAGVPPCVDAVDCTDNACDEPSDTCSFPLNDANCDDADPCTTDTCTLGGCVTSPGATITVDLDLEGINTPVSRDVTFAITDCDGGTDMRVINVDFDAVGAAQVVIGGVTGVSDWISAVEGHTLRRLAPLSFVACSALVDLTGGARVMGGDFQTGAVSKDNLVDVTDFSILASRWNQPIDATLSTGADATGDGFQSTADFAAIQANFLLVGDAVDGCPATAGDVIVTGYEPLDDGTNLSGPGPADDDEGDGMDVGNANLPDAIDEWSARNPIEPSHRLDAAVPMARLRVSQLPSRELGAADLDGDGFVDANDIRLFAEIHGLDLSPRFRVERDALKPEPLRRTRR